MAYLGSKLRSDEEEILYWFKFFQILFNGTYALLIGFYMWLIYNKAMHLNVKVLMMHLPIPYFINSLAQTRICLMYFEGRALPSTSDLVVIISDSAIFCNFYNMNVLIAERVLATLKVSKYERIDSKIPKTAISLIIAQWILSILTFFAAHAGFFNFIVCVIAFCNSCIVVAVFILLPPLTKRIHNNFRATYDNNSKPAFSSIWSVTLSQRYQSTENLRLSRLVHTLLGIEVLSVTIELLIHMAVRLNSPLSLPWFAFLTSLFLSVGIESIVLMVVVGYGTRPRIQKRRRTTVVGQKLTPEAINRLYFETYERAWNN